MLCVGVAAGSGMAAATMLCQLLKTGDHIVSTNDCYGGTHTGLEFHFKQTFPQSVTPHITQFAYSLQG